MTGRLDAYLLFSIIKREAQQSSALPSICEQSQPRHVLVHTACAGQHLALLHLASASTSAAGNQLQVSNWMVVVALQVRVWDVNTLKCLATLTGHSGAVRALAASSKRVFSGSDDTTIKVRRKFLHYMNLAARPLSFGFRSSLRRGLILANRLIVEGGLSFQTGESACPMTGASARLPESASLYAKLDWWHSNAHVYQPSHL